jgi:adenosylcobinamide-GDP ribazoletransferase
MKRFFIALNFLTRLSIPSNLRFETGDIGRATLFFPLIGALIGLIQTGAALGFSPAARGNSLKSILVAGLLVVINVFVTGALHLDGLADTADGFGGGHTKERVLEIMRDSLIGSFGAVGLILLIILKVAALAALIESGSFWQILIIAPALARWAIVPLGKFLPYARKSGGLGQTVTDYVGWNELIGASFIMVVLMCGLLDLKTALVFGAVVAFITLLNVRLCLKKIGGITGDTMGANTEICETAILFAAVFLK